MICYEQRSNGDVAADTLGTFYFQGIEGLQGHIAPQVVVTVPTAYIRKKGTSHLSTSFLRLDKRGTHSNSGRSFSVISQIFPVTSSMLPFVGLLRKRPVLVTALVSSIPWPVYSKLDICRRRVANLARLISAYDNQDQKRAIKPLSPSKSETQGPFQHIFRDIGSPTLIDCLHGSRPPNIRDRGGLPCTMNHPRNQFTSMRVPTNNSVCQEFPPRFITAENNKCGIGCAQPQLLQNKDGLLNLIVSWLRGINDAGPSRMGSTLRWSMGGLI